jgi:hypothetical protein
MERFVQAARSKPRTHLRDVALVPRGSQAALLLVVGAPADALVRVQGARALQVRQRRREPATHRRLRRHARCQGSPTDAS